MARFMTRFVIFSNSKKSKISNLTIFAGGPTLGGGAEPGRADGAWPSPRPAEREPDQVCEIPIPRDVGLVRPASFQSHWSSARPGP